ncbi:MAG: hypothetical protein IJ008_01000 [Clostridia bacterium]|nr:hypothetical protein [Clostridia bacterium]
MLDKCLYKGVDIFNPIEGRLDSFVDSFVKVYGEKYRPVIEKRLKNAKYFFLGGNFDVIIRKYKELEQEELNKIDKTKSLTPSLQKLKKKEIKEKYGKIIGVFEDAKIKLEAVDKKYDKATEIYLADRINLVRQLNKKPKLSNEQASKYASTLLEILYLGEANLLKTKTLLSSSKKQQYIDLFNAMGYEEKDINNYLKNRNLLDDIFDRQTIRQLNYWNKTKVDEINKENFLVAEMSYRLKKLKIYGKMDDFFDICAQYIKNQTSNSAFVLNCLTSDSKFNTLCVCKNALELTVEDLIHEMGHIIDSFVVDSSQEGFYYKIGYEVNYQGLSVLAKKNSEYDPNSKKYRSNEMFNEMLNEFISLKVSKEFKKTDKSKIFNNRKLGSKSYYEFGFEVFGDFLEKYQDKLIEFKLNIDKNEKAYEYFGESNFKKLIAMTKEYINARSELNMRACKGDKLAYDEIEELKFNTRLEFLKLEKEIEKHIAKQKAKIDAKTESSKTEPAKKKLKKSQFLDKIPFARYPKKFGGVKSLRAFFDKKSEVKKGDEKENLSKSNESVRTK